MIVDDDVLPIESVTIKFEIVFTAGAVNNPVTESIEPNPLETE